MKSPNPDALQRTAPRVPLAAADHPAAFAHPAPATFPQPARRTPQSLSLGSFGRQRPLLPLFFIAGVITVILGIVAVVFFLGGIVLWCIERIHFLAPFVTFIPTL